MPSTKLSRNIFLTFLVPTSENNDFYILTLQLKVETIVYAHYLPRKNAHASQQDGNMT